MVTFTKEYAFECMLKGTPIEIWEQPGKPLLREISILREMSIIVSLGDGQGSIVKYPLCIFKIAEIDGDDILHTRMNISKDHWLAPAK